MTAVALDCTGNVLTPAQTPDSLAPTETPETKGLEDAANAALDAALGMATGVLVAVIVVPIVSLALLIICIVCLCKRCGANKGTAKAKEADDIVQA